MAESFWRGLKTDFARKALWELTKYAVLGMVVAVWTGAAGVLLASQDERLRIWRWPVGVTAAALGLLATGWAYRRFRRYTPTFGPLDFDYLLVRKDVVYKRSDDGQVEYRRRFKLRALKNGLDRYTDKYHWTGSASGAPQAVTRGHTVFSTVRKNVWQFYEIRFPITLKRNQEIEAEVVWHFDDRDRAAVPFVSATIEEPTEHLTLSVTLPQALRIHSVIEECSSGIGAKTPFDSRPQVLDSDGSRIYDVTDPQLFHHYEIKWFYQ